MSALLEAEGLVKHFSTTRRRAVRAVDDVSFSIDDGRTLALVGESGSGKTTTARMVARLLEPDRGMLRLEGRDVTHERERGLREFRRRVQIVFQDPSSSLDPRWTVGASVAEPLRAFGLRRDVVVRLLDDVGLDPQQVARYPSELSSGQRQRVALARALALGPDLIVLDEPVSALDVSVRAQILNLLARLQVEHGLAYLFVTHDLAVVQHVADVVAVMYLGKIVERGPTAAVCTRPRHPYTQALLSSVPTPDPDARSRVRAALRGELPSPVDPPSGCRFRTRCPRAAPRCAEEEPRLTSNGELHPVACHFPD